MSTSSTTEVSEESPTPQVTPAAGAVRGVLIGLGLVIGLVGLNLLLSRHDFAQEKSMVVWLAGGVILHDIILSPILVGLAFLAGRVLPRGSWAPAVVGLIVLGAVTLYAIPVLGRYGADSNQTLLDRNYKLGWVIFAAVVVLAVIVGAVLRRRAGTLPPDPDGAQDAEPVAAAGEPVGEPAGEPVRVPVGEGNPDGPRPGGR